jgi:GntR family transcriptional regulator/MocR family aminotransferase
MSKNSSVAFPLIPLDKESSTPMHRQLYENYRTAILGQQLRAGAQLPSTRELAKHLQVSRNTVMLAFEQLLAEGFLTGKVGSGTFVTNQLLENSNRSDLRPPLIQGPSANPSSSRIADLLMERSRRRYSEGLGAFRASLPALDLFPWPAWSRLITACSRRQTREQLAYSEPLGLTSFREAVASYVRSARNVRCEADQVLVVSGSQQALCLAASVLLNEGDTVWMEDPGYRGARSAFLLNRLNVQPVPVDAEGLNVQRGEALCPEARMAYVTPSHQYPLGVTMSLQRRLELLNWAVARNAWIVEDDYDSEYRYVSRPLSSLQGLSEHDRVIYIGTFSKVLYPSLRVGYMVVPTRLVSAFSAIREASDIYPPTLFQMVLTDFIAQGAFARHLRRMRSIYSERLQELLECVHRELSDRAHIEAADSGLHVVLFLSKDVDDVAVCKEAARQGVTVMPLSICYEGGPIRRGLILGFGGTNFAQIRSGTVALKRALDRVCTNGNST